MSHVPIVPAPAGGQTSQSTSQNEALAQPHSVQDDLMRVIGANLRRSARRSDKKPDMRRDLLLQSVSKRIEEALKRSQKVAAPELSPLDRSLAVPTLGLPPTAASPLSPAAALPLPLQNIQTPKKLLIELFTQGKLLRALLTKLTTADATTKPLACELIESTFLGLVAFANKNTHALTHTPWLRADLTDHMLTQHVAYVDTIEYMTKLTREMHCLEPSACLRETHLNDVRVGMNIVHMILGAHIQLAEHCARLTCLVWNNCSIATEQRDDKALAARLKQDIQQREKQFQNAIQLSCDRLRARRMQLGELITAWPTDALAIAGGIPITHDAAAADLALMILTIIRADAAIGQPYWYLLLRAMEYATQFHIIRANGDQAIVPILPAWIAVFGDLVGDAEKKSAEISVVDKWRWNTFLERARTCIGDHKPIAPTS